MREPVEEAVYWLGSMWSKGRLYRLLRCAPDFPLQKLYHSDTSAVTDEAWYTLAAKVMAPHHETVIPVLRDSRPHRIPDVAALQVALKDMLPPAATGTVDRMALLMDDDVEGPTKHLVNCPSCGHRFKAGKDVLET